MKDILFAAVCMLAVCWGCSREDGIQPDLAPENLYVIRDNPSDPVQHRAFGLYQTYGVPVFFNDTIGRTFVKTDLQGDSIYSYELIDPAWSFTGYDNLEYRYTYMTDPEEQMRYLDMLEEFFSTSSPTLHPFSVFVVDSYETIGHNDNINRYAKGKFSLFYRVLMVTGQASPSTMKELPGDILRRAIEVKITDYIDLLSAFNRVSASYLGKRDWEKLGITRLTNPFECIFVYPGGYEEHFMVENFVDYPINGGADCLKDNWYLAPNFSPEMLDQIQGTVRHEIGKYGFVGSSVKDSFISVPPVDEEDDLKVFVKEVMRHSKEDFARLWGASPLVMQKYAIIADVIENKLGVEL